LAVLAPRIAPDLNLRAIVRRLLGYIRPHRAIVAVSLAATAVQAVADAVVPLLMAQVVEQLQTGERSLGAALRVPVLIALIFPIRGIMDFAAQYGLSWVGRSVVQDLRRELFSRYLSLPAHTLDGQSSGALIAKMTFNTEQVPEAIFSALIILARDSLTIVLLVGTMLYLSPKLTLLVAIVVPIVWMLVAAMSRALRRSSARIQASIGDFTQLVQQVLSDHRTVKMFDGEQREQLRFADINRRNLRLNVRLAAVNALGSSLTQWVVAMGVAAVMFATLSGWVQQDVTASLFMGFIAAMGMLLAPLKRLTGVNGAVQRAVVAAASVFDALDQAPEPDSGTRSVERVKGDVEFRDVTFGYDGSANKALKGVGFAIAAGGTLAIVGRSGSGKSTLISLLARFYEADSGSILVDGTDIRSYELRSLRRQLSLVSQDVFVFDDTLFNNIAYGAPSSCSREEIVRAAQSAGVMEFAESLPDGLDTRIGERGTLLSGGQRQRVSIARALLKDAPILLLDEATSALDTHSEQLVQEALAKLMRGRTTLVVAHRLSTIRHAERIVVVEDGLIVESGAHADLLARNGHYAALYAAREDRLNSAME
jgi:subfamily B ATP-binding cassette protein MsbA